MKKYICLLIAFLPLLVSCLKYDSIPGPNCVLEGIVIDRETGEPLDLMSTIRCEEINPDYLSPSYYDIPMKPGTGTFYDGAMFHTKYKVYPYNMPAVCDTIILVETDPETPQRLEIKAIPFRRMTLRAENDTLILNVVRPEAVPYKGGLLTPYIAYSTNPIVAHQTVSQNDKSMVWVDPSKYASGNFENKDVKIPMTIFPYLKKGEYYFRFMATISGANTQTPIWSTTVKAEFSGERPDEQ